MWLSNWLICNGLQRVGPFQGPIFKLGTHTLNINLSDLLVSVSAAFQGFHISDLPLCISWSPFSIPSLLWLPLFLLDLVHHTCLCTGVSTLYIIIGNILYILMNIKSSRAESMSYLSVFFSRSWYSVYTLQMFIWMSKSFETTLTFCCRSQGLPK